MFRNLIIFEWVAIINFFIQVFVLNTPENVALKVALLCAALCVMGEIIKQKIVRRMERCNG